MALLLAAAATQAIIRLNGYMRYLQKVERQREMFSPVRHSSQRLEPLHDFDVMGYTHIKLIKVIINHHNQEASAEASQLLHLIIHRPERLQLRLGGTNSVQGEPLST